MIGPDVAATRGRPRPLAVVLAPARDEALSSWLARHATFYGLSTTNMRRHCVPDSVSLPGLDRQLTPDQEARLAQLFRRDPVAIRQMTHRHLGPALSQLVARHVDHRCGPCARRLAAEGHAEAIPRSWFHTWRITCGRCGSPVVSASKAAWAKAAWAALPDLFPHLRSAALEGERLLSGILDHNGPAASACPMTLLRMLMISTASTAIPGHSGRALDAIVPGFNATLDRHGIVIPFSTLIDVPLPVRPILPAGLRFALEEVDAALAAIRDVTSGMHRTHLSFLVGDLDTATRSRHWRA